jgi:conjugative relaxase-like TrwC/TraI family protein
VTVSIRRMSLGSGYEYLINSVARGDGAAASTSALTRYYAESGTPPGRFLGAGLAGLNNGDGVAEGAVVTEQMLFRMLGMVADPITGEPFGRAPRDWPRPLSERMRDRVAQIPVTLDAAGRAAELARIEVEESERERHLIRPVAGFDLTFSVPKSVSAAWALADPNTQAVIYQAHQDAIKLAVGYAEQHVFFSRSGANGVIQEPVRGVVAAAFDHWDSRAGDPHLHTHVAVLNRAQSLDDTWRTLDSRGLFKYVVALSELHEGVLADLLTDRLGWGWDERARRHSPVPRHDVTGVADELIAEFSQRSTQIEDTKSALVAQFVTAHGRQPTSVEVLRLRQRATLATRPDKQHHSLRELTRLWRARACPYVGPDTAAWVHTLRDRSDLPPLRSADLREEILRDAATAALATVAERRSTFSHANVLAEVHRQLHGVRFASPTDRITVGERTVRLALDQALLLTPAPDGPVPAQLQRPDGTSKLRFRGSEIYSTRELFDAEARLLTAGRTTGGPGVGAEVVADVSAANVPGTDHRLGADQAAVITAVATSGRVLDLLVGPAGAGKTASLAGLRASWERQYGPGSVTGLAPSAAAAEVLADELGIDTENIAKWLTETRRDLDRASQIGELRTRLARSRNRGSVLSRQLTARINTLQAERDRWTIQPGQLVIIDEASLAGTLALDEIVTLATAARAKVLLVGDWAQLSAIQAGGAFTMLTRDRADVPELTQVRRFMSEWERVASIQLRAGDNTAIAQYEHQGRIHSGNRADMLDTLYTAWRDDTRTGRTSLMIAGDLESVAELNQRARHDRVLAGHVSPTGVPLSSGAEVGVGDRIITRQNNRRLTINHRWVKNGDTWTVHAIGPDGSLTVRPQHGNGEVVLPTSYVRHHVELGYAATAYRTQGRTVDTAHVLITPTTTREVLYVAATRGRLENHIYLDTRYDPDIDTSHGPIEANPAETVLRSVLQSSGADVAAHAVIERHRPQVTPTGIAPSRLLRPTPEPARTPGLPEV